MTELQIIKICRTHGKLKRLHVIKAGIKKDGSQSYKCKACQQELRKINYQKNKVKINLKSKKWRENNPERHKELNKRYKKNKQVSVQEKNNFYENLKPSVLRASKRLIGCIIELNRIERRVNKKHR